MNHRMLLVTTFGLGLLRPAPGTWGSLPPVVAAGFLILTNTPDWVFSLIMLIGAVVFTLLCVVFGDEAEARYRKKDPSQVVADETAGQCVALLVFPINHPLWWILLAVAFFAFRCFDIVKPPPAGWMQRIHGGWGIVLDDLFAGAMALAVVWAAAWVL